MTFADFTNSVYNGKIPDRIMSDKPLVFQSNLTILAEVNNPQFREARAFISLFAELEKSPDIFHTYRITDISVWNACALDIKEKLIFEKMDSFSRYPVPEMVKNFIRQQYSRYGKFSLHTDGDFLLVRSDDPACIEEIRNFPSVSKYIIENTDMNSFRIPTAVRGDFKQQMIMIGYPVDDQAGFKTGSSLAVSINKKKCTLRSYQEDAVDAFHAGGKGGAGVIVLPCGAGKTIVGMGIMEIIQTETLIVTTNIVAVRQWKQELISKTSLTEDLIGEYSGEQKEIKPVTIATYKILTFRKNKNSDFLHFALFEQKNWGLIIYDEIHLLPAPVFRKASEMQVKRRLGLTATLLREDGKEKDVFTLIGPKKYDLPWKDLEQKKFIAEAECVEIRVDLPERDEERYILAGDRIKYRIAAENSKKIDAIRIILAAFQKERILIIGEYIRQLFSVADEFSLPIITGSTPNSEREKLYDSFKKGNIPALVVSRVANFAVDLPLASTAIQISGTFGSRQEEAQRLGRILRPKPGSNRAWFFSIITRNSREDFFNENRKRFLLEQGYHYHVIDGNDLEKELHEGLNCARPD